MGQINRKGSEDDLLGQHEALKVKSTWEVPQGQRAERGAQALFESLR